MTEITMLKRAYKLAQDSPDPSTQNGAIIGRDSVGIAEGYNRFPDGVYYKAERWERPTKYAFVEHAERNAIYDAAKRGVVLSGAVMFCPWAACSDCARGIVQSGIRELYVDAARMADTSMARWNDSIAMAMTILKEGKVQVIPIEGPFGYKILIDGVLTEV